MLVDMRVHGKSSNRKKGCAHQPDLLVVIGIIALLVSILLPSLSRARYLAKVLSLKQSYAQYELYQDYLSLHLKTQAGDVTGKLSKIAPIVNEDDINQRNLVSQIAKFFEAKEKGEKVVTSKEEGALNFEDSEDLDKASTALSPLISEMKLAFEELSPRYKKYLENSNKDTWSDNIFSGFIGLFLGMVGMKFIGAIKDQ